MKLSSPPFEIFVYPSLGTSRTYLIKTKSEKILIDPGWPSFVLPIIKSHPDISLIVLTHRHYDHHGAAPLVNKLTRAPIVAAATANTTAIEIPPVHTFIFKLIRSWARAGFFFPRLTDFVNIALKLQSVDAILKDGDFIDKSGLFKVVSTPGHTSDSICIYSPKYQVLFSGDTIVNPFNKPRWVRLITNRQQFSDTQHKIARLQIKKVYPGHGEPFLLTDAKMLYEH